MYFKRLQPIEDVAAFILFPTVLEKVSVYGKAYYEEDTSDENRDLV